MNKKKNKIFIVVLVLLIICAIVGDVCLIIFSKKNILPSNNEKIIEEKPKLDKKAIKQYDCEMPNIEYFNEEVKIKMFLVEDKYSFYVLEDNTLYPNKYIITSKFDNKEDLNKYFDYLIKDLGLSEKDNVKDEESLTISYLTPALQGGFKYFTPEVLEYLNNRGYTCEEVSVGSVGDVK